MDTPSPAERALGLVDEVLWAAAPGPTGRLRLAYVSPAVRRLVGHRPEDLVGGRVGWQALVDPEDRRRVRTQQLAALRGEAGSLEHRLRAADGQVRWVRSSFSPTVDGGRLVHLAGTVADVSLTQRHDRSRMLRSLATLAGGVAHGVNNQMVAILGHLAMLEQELHGHAARWRLDRIDACARDIAHRADQLLAYARGGKHRVTRSDFGALLEGAASMVREPPAPIELDVDAEVPRVEGDPRQLLHAMHALLQNAAEAAPHRGPVRASARVVLLDAAFCRALPGLIPGQFAQLTVEDQGVGMDPGTLARCFEPFFSTKGRGRGLGLAACYGIITNHGGHVAIESAPGAGTVARLYLPVAGTTALGETDAHDIRRMAAMVETTPSEPVATPAVRVGKTVLVVDDEPAIVEVLQEHLGNAGYRVLVARDGRMAVDVATREPGAIDLIFLDLSMPVMDGTEAFPHLRHARPAAKVVIASGYDLDARAQRLLDRGADRFLQKPFRADVLVGMVDELLVGE